jgi:hypothetical protein
MMGVKFLIVRQAHHSNQNYFEKRKKPFWENYENEAVLQRTRRRTKREMEKM